MQLRIGIGDARSTIEIEVEDAAAVVDRVERAFADGDHLFRFIDVAGRVIVVPLDKLAFLDVEPEKSRVVGFAGLGSKS